jgi:site-specific DNA-methyltransferase (adenine-specific)
VKKPSRKKTSTSTFGTSGRVSHDSSKFYKSRLYDPLTEKKPAPATDNALPSSSMDKIFHKSSEVMEELPDHSVHLMIPLLRIMYRRNTMKT